MSAIWYEIRIAEILDERWSQWFEGMEMIPCMENGIQIGTLLCGCLPDQAALFGVLSQVRNLNLTLIAFRRTNDPGHAKSTNGKRRVLFQVWI